MSVQTITRDPPVESAMAESGMTVDRERGLFLLKEMIRIRRLEEKSAQLYSAMKIRGFLHLYNGEEAVGVGVLQALTPEDNLLSTYREHGQALRPRHLGQVDHGRALWQAGRL